jgi:hypothetical protein
MAGLLDVAGADAGGGLPSHDGGAVPSDGAAAATSDARIDGPGAPDAVTHDAAYEAAPADAQAAPPLPATCDEADAGSGTSTTTLYVGGDPSEPWTAVCSGGKAYLPLTAKANVSTYPAGGCATPQPASVTTTWSMVRLDPVTLLVDTSDFSGASSSGDTHEVSGNGSYVHDYARMPYGAARSCDDQDHSKAFATIDLGGTPFAVADTQTWQLQGWSNNNAGNLPYGRANPPSGRTVSLTVGGFPAGISPCNDFYQTAGGACLQLVYSP